MTRHSLDRDSSYLYRIQPHPFYGFSTGLDAKGRQAIVGILDDEEILLFFTSDGDLHQTIQRSPQQFKEREPSVDLESKVRVLADTSLVKQSSISVKKFHVRLGRNKRDSTAWEYDGIGIEDVPWHFRRSETGEYDAEIAKWFARGDFVLWWGNDFDLNVEGEVMSS